MRDPRDFRSRWVTYPLALLYVSMFVGAVWGVWWLAQVLPEWVSLAAIVTGFTVFVVCSVGEAMR